MADNISNISFERAVWEGSKRHGIEAVGIDAGEVTAVNQEVGATSIVVDSAVDLLPNRMLAVSVDAIQTGRNRVVYM